MGLILSCFRPPAKPLRNIEVSHPFPLAPRVQSANTSHHTSPSRYFASPYRSNPVSPVHPTSPSSTSAGAGPERPPKAVTLGRSRSRGSKLRKPLRVEGDWDLWTPLDLEGFPAGGGGEGRMLGLDGMIPRSPLPQSKDAKSPEGDAMEEARSESTSTSSDSTHSDVQDSPQTATVLIPDPQPHTIDHGNRHARQPSGSAVSLATGLSAHWEVIAWMRANGSHSSRRTSGEEPAERIVEEGQG